MRINKELRGSTINIAYKLVPLPSGCNNCWGDLSEECTEECRKSSDNHSKKIDEAINLILARDISLKQKLMDALPEIKDWKIIAPHSGDGFHSWCDGYNQSLTEITEAIQSIFKEEK